MGWLSTSIGVLIGIIAIGMTIFTNYPAPPYSPILFQWKSQGHYLQYKDYKIFYIDEIMDENSTRPALVCLHGFPSSSFDYYKMYPQFRRMFDRIIFVDFLGLGFSDKPRFHIYTLMEQTQIVENLMKHLKVKDVHLLSHDYGDTVAQELIARQNEDKSIIDIKSVHLTNGGIFPSLHHPILFQRLLTYPIIGTILSRFHNFYVYRYVLSTVFGDKKLTNAEMHDFWHIARFNDGFRVFGHLLNYMDERKTHETRWVNALKLTNIPIQFIYGPADPINRKSEFIQHFRQQLPNAHLDLLDEKVGHYPNIEDPINVFKLIVKYLNQINFDYKL